MKIFPILLLLAASVAAREVPYNLTISQTQLSPAGKERTALTINGGIPGPTLRFREGDTAVITVRNDLPREETSLHWHGLLVPNGMDGVPYLTTPPIKAGTSREFRFKLTHPGTYWYHSHTGLQEQRGVYGSIVVTPKGGEPVKADRDYVLVLSDWTNESPGSVMRALMSGTEYYAVKKGNAQSIVEAARAGELGSYFQREKSRMAPMDLSDVYYDSFLINGQKRSHLEALPGERVRLRLINAGASSYFYAHSATGPLTIVAADGPAVQATPVEKLLIGMAETYDVIVTIPKSGSWEFRATAQDNSGHASIFLGDGDEHVAAPIPSPNLYSMDHMLEAAMGDGMSKMNMARPSAPYQQLRSTRPTAIPAQHPRREIELRLTGDMKRYLWSFNGKTLAEDSTIPVRKGEVLRIELINDTMMHHPLHLHGHFFRLLNGQGDRSPLKHTVDVSPMGKQTIEFLANEEGDWFFHCHLLYHMDAGMARVFSYQKAVDPSHELSLDPKLIEPSYLFAQGMVLNNHSMGGLMLMKGREDFGLMWDSTYGDHDQYEVDAYWSHYFNPNLRTLAGYRFTDIHGEEDRAFAGVSYRLPYLVESTITLDSEGDARLELGKEFRITPRFSAALDLRYDTLSDLEWSVGASYLLNKEFSLTGQYHSEHGWGAGFSFRF